MILLTMTPWRRFRMWIFLADMRREHKSLVRSFSEDPRAEAAKLISKVSGLRQTLPAKYCR